MLKELSYLTTRLVSLAVFALRLPNAQSGVVVRRNRLAIMSNLLTRLEDNMITVLACRLKYSPPWHEGYARLHDGLRLCASILRRRLLASMTKLLARDCSGGCHAS